MTQLPTIKLKGKDYVLVSTRIEEFRTNEKYNDWALISEITHTSSTSITMKATVLDHNGNVRATGHATEIVGSGGNPKITENCETSAWGRALGNLGIGIQESIASAEEMQSFYEKNIVSEVPEESIPTGEIKMCTECNKNVLPKIGKNGKQYYRCFDCKVFLN